MLSKKAQILHHSSLSQETKQEAQQKNEMFQVRSRCGLIFLVSEKIHPKNTFISASGYAV